MQLHRYTHPFEIECCPSVEWKLGHTALVGKERMGGGGGDRRNKGREEGEGETETEAITILLMLIIYFYL